MAHLVIASPLGPLTVFDDAEALVALEWGKAPLGESSALLEEAKKQLDAYFAGRLARFDLPTRSVGTDFQRKVWKAMGRIPFGRTKTYGELARALGSAARAVGGACGANPLPIIVPCHRVVGADHRLTGYSGGEGIDTKRFLLRHEGAKGF